MRARIGKSENLKRVALRLPKVLQEELAEHATMNHRSLNYEIELRLNASIELGKIFEAHTDAEKIRMLDRLKRRLVGFYMPLEGD